MTHSRPDLTTRADVERLVDAFYTRVRADDLLGPIVDEVAQVDWAAHLPKMYAFWETVLFGASGFKGNPLAVHRQLARRTPMTQREFDRWLTHFHATVDELFDGPIAHEAKLRAVRVAQTMLFHIGADAAAAQPDAAVR